VKNLVAPSLQPRNVSCPNIALGEPMREYTVQWVKLLLIHYSATPPTFFWSMIIIMLCKLATFLENSNGYVTPEKENLSTVTEPLSICKIR
jgi:hypothetical protein